jgi:hypothetical protein
MTQETIRNLTDTELQQAKAWIAQEEKDRTQRRKRETIAKIKALAALGGVAVSIAGTRGRPRGNGLGARRIQSAP